LSLSTITSSFSPNSIYSCEIWTFHSGEDDIFWGVSAPCRLVGRCLSFGETYYCLHLQSWSLTHVYLYPPFLTLFYELSRQIARVFRIWCNKIWSSAKSSAYTECPKYIKTHYNTEY
jgi:hypothetical protein